MKKFQNWQKLFDATIEPLMLLDLNGNLITLNKKISNILDKNLDDLIGLNIFSFMSPNEVKFFEAQINNILRLGKPVRIEKEIFGTILDLYINPIFDEQGKVEQIAFFSHDIIECKKKEEDFEKKYSNLNQIFNLTIPLCVIDKEFNLIRLNNNFSSLFNVKREEIIGKKCYNVIPGPLCNTPECTLKQILSGKDHYEYEKEFELIDGNKIVCNMRAVPYRKPDGEFIGIIKNYTDITAHKKGEISLRNSEEFLQNIFDAIQDGVSVLDKDLNIIRTNYWMEKLYNSDLPLIGKKCYVVYQKRTTPCPWCPSKLTLETGELHSAIGPYPSIENQIKWLEIVTVPFKNSEGITVGIIEHIKDITNRKHMEEKLQESENKYRILFEEAADSILIVNAETGELADFNRAAYRNLGYNYEEFKQIKLSDFEVVETPEEIKKNIEKINRASYGNFITKHKSKDGKIRDIHKITKPITIHEKTFLISICRDITERKKIEDMLKLNKERYSLATNAAKVGVWDWNIENCEFYLDPNVKMILGYNDEEIPNDLDAWETHAHSDDSKGVMESIQVYLEGKASEYIDEFRMLYKDGSIRWLQVRGRAIRDTQGNAIRMVGTYTDVTAQKKAEVKLKISETKLIILNKELEHKVKERTKELECLYNLSKILEDTKITKENKIIRAVNMLPSAMQFPDVICARIQVDNKEYETANFMKTKWNQSSEIFVNGKKVGFVEVSYLEEMPSSDEGFFLKEEKSLIDEISDRLGRNFERLNAEKKLQESEELSRIIINNISDVLMESNIDGTITFISPQIYDIIGYHPKELIGIEFLDLFHPEEKLVYEKQLNRTPQAGNKIFLELRIMHKKGYYVPVSVKGNLKEANKNLEFFIVIRDITEKIKIDNMMKREIKKLKELDQIRSDLIRRISHELKTPLISIFSGSQYLLDHSIDNYKAHQIIELIHMGGHRLKNLTDNLILAYNIDSKELNLNLKRKNIIHIIRNCIEDIVFQAKKRNIYINVELLKELYIEVDKSMIKRAISNIFSNAVKNTPNDGNIFVSTFEHPNYIDIIVKDDGVGLTKKEELLLFKRFGKIERHGKGMGVDIEGVGLGLYIANEIVKLHYGEIIIESKGRNKGSTFTIRLYSS